MPRSVVVNVAFLLLSIGYLLAVNLNVFKLLLIFAALATLVPLISRSLEAAEVKALSCFIAVVLPAYLYIVISSITTSDPTFGFQNAIYACMTVFPLLVLGAILGLRFKMEELMSGFLLLTITLLVQAGANYFLRGDFMLTQHGSIRTVFAIAFCAAAPFLIGSAIVASPRRKLLIICVVMACLYVLRESRSVLIVVLPISLVLFYMYQRRIFSAIVYAVFAGGIAYGVASGLGVLREPIDLGRLSSGTSLDIGNVLDDMELPLEERVDFDRRLATFTAIDEFLKEPAFGIGYTGVWQENLFQYQADISAHGYIGNLGELGVVGMVIFAVTIAGVFLSYRKWILGSFRRMLRGKNSVGEPALALSLISVLAIGTFHQIMESVPFGLIMGLVLGYVWQVRRSKPSRNHHLRAQSRGRRTLGAFDQCDQRP